MKGSYILVIKVLTKKRIKIGKLGEIEFDKGFYVYVGSAMNGLEKRIERHLSSKKRMHWHIDYLLREGKITEVYLKASDKKEECTIAQKLSAHFESVDGFGSSDCRCKSHLFYSESLEKIRERVLAEGFQMYFEGRR